MFKKRRKTSTVLLYRLTLFILQALILFLALLFGGKNSDGLNEWIYQHALLQNDNEQPLRLGVEDEVAKNITYTKKRISYTSPTVYTLRLDSEALQQSLLGKDDYSPQDLAVTLKQLDGVNLRALALSSPLHWDLEEGDMGLISLILAFQKHEGRTLGLRGQLSSLADFTPECLQSGLIPLQQVKGDIKTIPQANKSMPNPLLQSQDITWAVDLIVGEQLMSQAAPSGTKGYPLIVQWNGEIYPSLPLRMAMDLLQIQTSDIQIKLGQSVQLGKRNIPIDDAGRIILNQAKSDSISLSQLIDGDINESLNKKCLIIEHTPKGTKAPEYRLNNLALTLSELIASETTKNYKVQKKENVHILQYINPASHKQGCIIAAIVLLCYLFILPLIPRQLCYAIYCCIAPAALFIALQYAASTGHWFNVGALISLLLALIIFTPMRWKKRY